MSSIIKAHTLGIDGTAAMEAHTPPTTPPALANNRACIDTSVSCSTPTSHKAALEALKKARQQAAALLAAAKAEAERLKEQGRAEGYAEGLQAGREQGLREGAAEGVAAGWGSGVEKAQEAVKTAQDMLAAAENERLQVLADLEGQVVELALGIAEKIVQHQIEREDPFIVQLIANALQQTGASGRVTTRVHPARVNDVAQSSVIRDMAESLQVIPDDTLGLGDCIVETDEGILDGRLSNRLNGIRNALESAVTV